MRIRDIIDLLFEADIVDFGAAKVDQTKKKVAGIVSGFQAYLDQMAAIKDQFGRYEPMLRQYLSNPSPREAPDFFVEVHFDHVAVPKAKTALKKLGFTVFNDDPDWGTPIYDDEATGSWSHGDYLLPGRSARERNWYTQTSAEKQVTPQEAIDLFAKRQNPGVRQQLGLYQPLDIKYHKGNLNGDPQRGWDIRTHADHANHFEEGKSFRLLFRSPDYSDDAEIRSQEDLDEAMRVYNLIHRAETIRLSGADNVVDLTRR